MSENTSLSNAAPKGESGQEMLLKLIKSILFLGSVLIGSVLLWSDVVWPLLKTIEARDWNAIPCVIISSQLNTQSGLTTTYSVDIAYSYEILGKTYQSNRYSFTDISSFNEVTAIVDRYPPGARTSCYVNPSYDKTGFPRNPTDAVIEQCDFPTALKRVFGVRPVVSLIFILFGIVGGLSIWSSFIARFIAVLVGLVVLDILVYFALVCFDAGAVSFIISVGLVFYMMVSVDSYRQGVKGCSPWKPLAASKHLTFVPGKFFFGHEPYITGTYRHHHLKLETLSKNKSIYTRLLVSGNALAQGSPQNEPHLPDDQVARKDVISLLTPTSPQYMLKGPQLKGSVAVQTVDQTVHVCYEQKDIENDSEYLGYLCDLLSDLAEAYPAVVALGGEAVPFLKDEIARKHHKSIAIALLEAIARDTTARIGDRASQVVCPSCLTRYKAHKVWPAGKGWFGRAFEADIAYYGCRICSQSREFLEVRVVAVLDSRMDTERVLQDGTLRVNWLARRALFDFDEVEIVQASDEDVERFAVQVGNDTDDFRRSRYKEMSCTIVPNCGLSENTLRILKNTFG